ncbi:hypothetical protein N779_02025 [Vibrio coralliilyticus OCN008]|nr:hypothetical protein N779_02025 [Vibrio coralliilyticus OCN008]
MQPINANNALKNGHVFAVGMSGSGKTSAAKKLFIKRPTKSPFLILLAITRASWQGEWCEAIPTSKSLLRP